MRIDKYLKISRIIKMNRLLINKFIEEYGDKNQGETPTIEEVSKALNIEEGDVIIALNCSKMTVSLNEKQDDDDSSGGLELIDKLGDDREEEKMVDKIMLKALIEKLPLRDRKIILLRFFRDKTQTETAKELGISQVQVSRLESKIIQQLKNKIIN